MWYLNKKVKRVRKLIWEKGTIRKIFFFQPTSIPTTSNRKRKMNTEGKNIKRIVSI